MFPNLKPTIFFIDFIKNLSSLSNMYYKLQVCYIYALYGEEAKMIISEEERRNVN